MIDPRLWYFTRGDRHLVDLGRDLEETGIPDLAARGREIRTLARRRIRGHQRAWRRAEDALLREVGYQDLGEAGA